MPRPAPEIRRCGGLALGLAGEGIQGEIAVGYDHLLNSRFLVGVFAHGRYGGGATSISGVEYRYLGYEALLDPTTSTELQPTAHTGQITLKYKV